jgi:hypothetical protein
MNWFKKLVIKWVREDWDNANKSSRPEMLVASRDVESISDGDV